MSNDEANKPVSTISYHPHKTIASILTNGHGPSQAEERLIEFAYESCFGGFSKAEVLNTFWENGPSCFQKWDGSNKQLLEGLVVCLAFGWYTPVDRLSVGAYDHFKGGVYKARSFTSSWASGSGERVVEYTSLLHGTDHVRLASQWTEVVLWPDGEYRARFIYRGPTLGTPPPAFKVPSPR